MTSGWPSSSMAWLLPNQRRKAAVSVWTRGSRYGLSSSPTFITFASRPSRKSPPHGVPFIRMLSPPAVTTSDTTPKRISSPIAKFV